MVGRRSQRIAIGARLFALVALSGPILWGRDQTALTALAGVAAVWLLASLVERRHHLARNAPVIEAALTGVVCGLTLDNAPVILLALAVPPFVAALFRGMFGTMVAISAELVAVVALALLIEHHISAEQSFTIFTWMVAALGLGLIGTFVSASLELETDELAPYLDAQRLIRQLLDLSNELSSGLDVTTLAGSVLSDVGDQIPTAGLAIYVPRGEVLVPLVTSDAGRKDALLKDAEELAVESWARSEPILHELAFAFPLGESVVVAGLMSPTADLDVCVVERTILRLVEELRAKSVQLDTALLFATFRDSASADVRKRLAREMHDGVAQDIAALGYLVDALSSRAVDDKQAKAFVMLRDRITAIVAEVRQSVLTLRTSIGESESLGVAIGAVARHLSESSHIPIQVTLDEHSTRLRPEIEAELFRIAQEAMNNAIKHAQCSAIEVNCQVHAPSALITIADDGRGLQAARSDSHGLKIMRERARLVGADLSIGDRPDGGLLVAVRIA